MLLIGSRGYQFVIDPDAPRAQARKVAVHRLVAYAYGMIDILDSPLEVDHVNRCKTDNRPANLEAVEPEEHGRRTRQRAKDAPL